MTHNSSITCDGHVVPYLGYVAHSRFLDSLFLDSLFLDSRFLDSRFLDTYRRDQPNVRYVEEMGEKNIPSSSTPVSSTPVSSTSKMLDCVPLLPLSHKHINTPVT